MVEGGQAWLAQRYAIDFAQFHMVDGKAFTWKGPEDKNTSYFCCDQPIHRVAPGKVVQDMDGLRKTCRIQESWRSISPGKTPAAITWGVDRGFGLYAFYAHMRPGSVAVREGTS